MISIDEIRFLCMAGKVKWSIHSSKRMHTRNIGKDDVIACLMSGEIIEEYPDYWLGPSALVAGYSSDERPLHVLVGIDEYLHVVTTYYPSPEKFEADMRTRKDKER